MHFTKVLRGLDTRNPAFLQVWGGSEVGNLRLHEVFRHGRWGALALRLTESGLLAD